MSDNENYGEEQERLVTIAGISAILQVTTNPAEIVDGHPIAYLKRIEMDDLDSPDLFASDLFVPGGPSRSCVSRSDGINYWMEIGHEEPYPSSEFRELLEDVFENPFVYQICVGNVFKEIKWK